MHLLLLMSLLLTPPSHVIERQIALMGTYAAMHIEASDRSTSIAASEAAAMTLREAEARLSTWLPDSELARFNRTPLGQELPLSAKLAEELHAARACSKGTSGAFRLGMGALVETWGLRKGGRLPSAREIRASRQSSDPRHFQLEGRRATRLHSALRIEEGGFGKGAALDDALRAARLAGASAASFNLGGQIAFFGHPRIVEIADPRDRQRTLLTLTIDSGSIATTGNSERAVRAAEHRVGHILDPRTGRPADDFGSVTVWSRSALEADCLATALFVLGPQEGLRWAAAQGDVEALFLVDNPASAGDRPRLLTTPGWEGTIRVSGDPNTLASTHSLDSIGSDSDSIAESPSFVATSSETFKPRKLNEEARSHD